MFHDPYLLTCFRAYQNPIKIKPVMQVNIPFVTWILWDIKLGGGLNVFVILTRNLTETSQVDSYS